MTPKAPKMSIRKYPKKVKILLFTPTPFLKLELNFEKIRLLQIYSDGSN